MGVQTFRRETAIERVYERIVVRLYRTGEIKCDAALLGPQVLIAGDELRILSTRLVFG